MMKNYFNIALRNILKNKTTSIIKIMGLAMGLSAALLIYLYVSFEHSYDKYHVNGERICRVAYHLKTSNSVEYDSAKTGINLAGMLQEKFPEIEETARVSWSGEVNILYKAENYKETKLMFGDLSVLTMFSFPMKYGDRSTALNERNSIVISSRIAKKYFGAENAVGMYLDDHRQFKVTGVMDVPDNSHFRFDILASFNTIYTVFPAAKNWQANNIGYNIYTYVLLKDNAEPTALLGKLSIFADEHLRMGNYTSIKPFLEPLERIHFDSSSEAYYGEFGLTKFTNLLIYLFEFLGLVIIGIACFNFINIAIVQIATRSKEVGVRKVYGAKKSAIFIHFVCEYGLYSIIAVFVSVLIVQLSLPWVSSVLGLQLHVNYNAYLLACLSGIAIMTLLAGAYPSIVISKVNAISALNSGFRKEKGNVLRSFLVILQFSISIILILSTVYITKQINHFSEMDMGINTKDVLVVQMNNSKIRKNYESFKSELLRNPNVLSVSASSNIPAVTGASTINLQIDDNERISFPYISIDPGFTQTLGVKMIVGSSFNSDELSESKAAFLLNKEAADILHLDHPVGTGVVLSNILDENHKPISSGKVIGVIDNYAYRPSYDKVRGVVFSYDPNKFRAMFIRLNRNAAKETSIDIGEEWATFFPEPPFEASFLSEDIKNDEFILKLHSLKKFISIVAIFSFIIALLGLLSLSIFAAKQRVKEIGIRRVNGALISELVVLMNQKFMVLVLLAICISFPIVILIIEDLKKSSPTSVNMPWTTYAIAFLVIVCVSLLTVSWQSWKAATRNPIESLRYE